MIPTNRLKRTGIATLHQRSANTGLMIRILSDGGLLDGMPEFGRMLRQ